MVLEKIIKNVGKGVAALGLAGTLALGTFGCNYEGVRATNIVIVNTVEEDDSDQPEQPSPMNQRHFFACNYINGSQIFPQDYVGMKNVFGASEPIILVDYDPFDKTGDQEKLDIYSPSGKLVGENKITVARDGATYETGVLDGSNTFTQLLVQRGGYGNYRAVFSLNNQTIGEVDFTITN